MLLSWVVVRGRVVVCVCAGLLASACAGKILGDEGHGSSGTQSGPSAPGAGESLPAGTAGVPGDGVGTGEVGASGSGSGGASAGGGGGANGAAGVGGTAGTGGSDASGSGGASAGGRGGTSGDEAGGTGGSDAGSDEAPAPSPLADGEDCDLGDDCDSGHCVGGVCCAQACDAPPTCHQLTGTTCVDDGTTCQYGTRDDGDACDDDDPCTDADHCSGGSCVSTEDGCDDDDACTVDACDPSDGGCDHSALVCNDGNACTNDGCNPASGCTVTNNSASCNDGSACTTSDACSGGSCGGTPVSCNDAEPCTTDSCNPAASGNPCVHTNNALACNDGDSCTSGDKCAAGSCEPGGDACGEGQLTCTPGATNVCTCVAGYSPQPGACVSNGPNIPAPPPTCPTLATGTITVLGQSVRLWVGARRQDKKGAVYFYWHGTGGNATEAMWGMGSAFQEIVADGGVIASFTTTTGTGSNTANGVWYTGDFAMADQILACAVQQLNIDTRRVYTGGCSAGGLQAGAMTYGRSSYLAGVAPNSGGIVRGYSLQDPSHVPSVITAHGALGVDAIGIEFTTTSLDLCTDVVNEGGFAVDCDHGGEHCGSPSPLVEAQWTFLKAHPWGVAPEPYAAGLPSFPSYCHIIE